MKNIFKLIIRNLFRKPLTTIINLVGLSISLALVLFLSAYSFSEFKTDKFHENQKNIYLIQPGNDWIYTPAILKPSIDNNIAGVERTIRMRDKWNAPVYQFENNEPIESDLIFADYGFFEMFDYQVLEGDLKTALAEPMSLVISEKLSGRLFAGKSALGKTIKLDDKHNLTVKAVLRNQTSNTIFSFNSISNIETIKKVQPNKGDFTNWGYNNYQTFLQLNKHVNFQETEKSIVQVFPEEERKDLADFKLHPLSEIYFSGMDVSSSFIKSGSKTKVFYLTIVALLVLVVALVNFINITSAHWQQKIKQTGVLKVIGAKRSTIILHLLFETFFLFTVALLLGYVIIFLVSPYLAQKTGIVFNTKVLWSFRSLLIITNVVALLSFLCGIVPALRIASSETLINLKKKVAIKSKKYFGKGIMVSTQFVVAIVLILFTILIQKQVDYASNKLGVNQENIIGIPFTTQLAGKKEVLKESLLAQANVEEVIFTQYYPGKMNSGWGSILQINGDEINAEYRTFSADAGFFDVMGLELIEGRFYENHLESDQHKVVVNQQFLEEYGITDPIGVVIPKYRGPTYEIVGVVKDFHFKSVNESIAPLVIRNDHYASVALVRLKTKNFQVLKSSFESIKALTAELSPTFPVNVTFFDQAVEAMYQSEVKFKRAFSLFAICAIVISCMGILAMSLFATEQRIKEIGIRKVNGAKVSEILSMLNKDFIKWVGIAFVVACPIAYYAMNKWLDSFAYKTELSWWIFVLAGILALGIALLTVSWQSWRAATRNPVEALRYE